MRHLLSSTAVSSLLALGVGQAHANDLCEREGTTETCEGDQSDGVRAGGGARRLIVRNLSGDITPPASQAGVSIYNYQRSVTVETDLGPFAIRSSGAGITAGSYNGGVSITHDGDIITTGDTFAPGIRAASSGYNFNRITIETGSGAIETAGANSAGILSSGGYNVLTNITSASAIKTSGDGSAGITSFGGNSTFIVITGDIETSGTNSAGARASSGYEAASINNVATISTEGEGSVGLVASGYNSASILNTGDVATLGDNSSALVSSATSYTARVTSSGSIRTAGRASRGVTAFSQYGEVEITLDGDVSTSGDEATAVLAQSYYGGADVQISTDVVTQGVDAHGVSVSSGRYGASQIDLVGSITTSGDGANAILARPNYSDLSIQLDDPLATITTSGDGATAVRVAAEGSYYSSLAINVAGAITTQGADAPGIDLTSENHTGRITISGDLTTLGDRSPGIRSQTYNGLTELVVSGSLHTSGAQSTVIDLSGEYYSQMDVEISNGAQITSVGDDAPGVSLRANTGEFNIQHDGQILTTGAGAHGLSIENGGTGEFSTVTIVASGDVDVSGTDAHGLHISAAGTTTLDLSGAISGGSGNGAGVSSTGSGDVNLALSGSIGAESGLAISTGAGSDDITSTGFIRGNISLGGGENQFNHAIGGRLETGEMLDLGAQGQFENSGLIILNQEALIGSTALVGDFVQTDTGELVFDVDLVNGTADQLQIEGSADIGGDLTFNVVSADVDPSSVADSVGIEVITTTGGLTLNGAEFSPDGFEIPDTVAFDFSLTGTDTSLVLNVDAIRLDFVPLLDGAGTSNQLAVADYLDRVRANGPADGLDTLVTSLRMSADSNSLQQQLGLLTPAILPALLRQTELRSEAALRSNRTCQTGAGSACIWVNLLWSEGEDTVEGAAFDENSSEVLFGGSTFLGPSTQVSAEATIGEFDGTLGSARSMDGDRLQIRTRIDRDLTPRTAWSTQAVWTRDEVSTQRASAIAASPALIAGETETTMWSLSTTLHHDLDWGGWTYAPLLGAGYSCFEDGTYSENGAGGEQITTQYEESCFASGRAGLHVGSPTWENSIWRTQIGLRAGVTARDVDDLKTLSTLAGAPSTIAPFESRFGASDEVIGSFAFGLQFSDLKDRWTTGVSLSREESGPAARDGIEFHLLMGF
ncbi:MAG: hypothetical protein AAF829_05415 [Pseudomonadota bacterium]